MTKKHGPKGYIVFIKDGDNVATVGPFIKEEDAKVFIDNSIAPDDNSGFGSKHLSTLRTFRIFVNYVRTDHEIYEKFVAINAIVKIPALGDLTLRQG